MIHVGKVFWVFLPVFVKQEKEAKGEKHENE